MNNVDKVLALLLVVFFAALLSKGCTDQYGGSVRAEIDSSEPTGDLIEVIRETYKLGGPYRSCWARRVLTMQASG